MKEPSDIDLLLIGKTGSGKSATGNSILRRRAFKSRSSTSSVTIKVDYEVSEFAGRVIKVVDGPGVGDTRLDNKEAINLVQSAMEYAITANPRGYHALLLVHRFGGRYTAEDQDTVAFLKTLFGESFVRDYCILVLTCGDNFENEDSFKKFETWCKEQTGVFAELMKECNNRVLLFDNTTKDERKKCDQIEKLLKMVDSLNSQGHRYTDEHFTRAREARERFILEAKEPVIREETMTEISLIILKVQNLQEQDDMKMKIEPLENLLIRAEILYHSISSQDRGTGVLRNLLDTARSVQRTVNEEVKFCHAMLKERERLKKREEETRRTMEEKLRKHEEEFENKLREERFRQGKRRKVEVEREKMRHEEEKTRQKEMMTFKRKLQKELEEEKKKQKEKMEELEKKYQEMKYKNNECFLYNLKRHIFLFIPK